MTRLTYANLVPRKNQQLLNLSSATLLSVKAKKVLLSDIVPSRVFYSSHPTICQLANSVHWNSTLCSLVRHFGKMKLTAETNPRLLEVINNQRDFRL